jgi:OmpA-OmpF porin, OOP family
MKRAPVFPSILAALLLSAPAAADNVHGRWGLRGLGGAAVPFGPRPVTNQGTTGPGSGGSLRYGLSSHWSADLSYESIGLKNGLRAAPLQAGAVYFAAPKDPWTPFLQIGAGVAQGIGSKSFNNPSVKTGVGIDSFLTRSLALGGAATYHYVSAAGGARQDAHAFTMGLTATAYFGEGRGLPDSDGDRVPDYKDNCPGTPAGTAVDKFGCPVDADGDGVKNAQDACPGTLEGVAVDQKGCPLDEDGDLVPDYLDRCPGTPAGVKVDRKGCPPDEDRDGVPDYIDQCPQTPRGFVVNKVGCPTQIRTGQKIRVRLEVQFDFDQAVVKPQYRKHLKKVAEFLQQYPDVQAVIEGHTDPLGYDRYNRALSLRRALSVKRYLTARFGIPARRLRAVGYGFSRPVASNATEAGRARNRRVIAVLEAMERKSSPPARRP